MARPADDRVRLRQIFTDALIAVGGTTSVRLGLKQRSLEGPVTLIAVGKAAQAMSQGACEVLGGRISGGLIVTKPGHLDPRPLQERGLEAVVGGHPLPTEGSLQAGRRLIELLQAGTGGSLLCLISGGASSLVEVPVAGLGLAELRRANQWLLGSGLPIEPVNLVRKALSAIKGGGLLRWVQERRVRALAISDVPGDRPDIIGSGLLVPEPDLQDRVRALALPDWLSAWVARGLQERTGLPREGPPLEIVANLDRARKSAEQAARERGLPAVRHDAFIAGEAGARGRELARALIHGRTGVHVWGGETTVQLPPQPGRGGRNQHLALAAALELADHDDCLLLSAGTDGTDGPTEEAGALVDGGTLARALRQGLVAQDFLARADAGTLLSATGDLIRTGPTGTNVMDLMLGLKLGKSP